MFNEHCFPAMLAQPIDTTEYVPLSVFDNNVSQEPLRSSPTSITSPTSILGPGPVSSSHVSSQNESDSFGIDNSQPSEVTSQEKSQFLRTVIHPLQGDYEVLHETENFPRCPVANSQSLPCSSRQVSGSVGFETSQQNADDSDSSRTGLARNFSEDDLSLPSRRSPVSRSAGFEDISVGCNTVQHPLPPSSSAYLPQSTDLSSNTGGGFEQTVPNRGLSEIMQEGSMDLNQKHTCTNGKNSLSNNVDNGQGNDNLSQNLNSTTGLRRSTRQRRLPEKFKDYELLLTECPELLFTDQTEPVTFKQACHDPYSEKWMEAMRDEMDSL